MKRPCLFFVIACFVGTGLFGAPPMPRFSIQNVDIEHMDDADFKGISETFTGKEATRNRLVVRTNPDIREGEYFIIELNRYVKHLPLGSQLQIRYVLSTQPEATTVNLLLPETPQNTSYIYAGLTGGNLLKNGASITAWQISLLAPSGETMAQSQSFLWKQP